MPFDPEDLFQCRRCGQCCRGYGGTYVEPADVDAIAAYIDCSPRDFIARYCNFSCGRPVLAQRADGYCIFWQDLCTIHPVKPRMCRRWPFIPALLREVANWHAMATACPGIQTHFDDETIRAVAARALADEAAGGHPSGHKGRS